MVRVAAVLAAICAVACASTPRGNATYSESVARGRMVAQQYGCGSCHLIPGVDGANSLAGPPLTWFAHRSFVAGEMPNTPDNLVRWIRTPQEIHPRTAMPNVGLTDQQARDVAAFLYTLR